MPVLPCKHCSGTRVSGVGGWHAPRTDKPYLCYPLRVVITVDSCLLSLIIGGLTTVCEVECGSRANNDRVLAKVVGRVVARWGGQHAATGVRGRGEVDPLLLRLPSVEPVRSAQLWDSRTLLAFHTRRPAPRSGLFPAVIGPR